MIAFQILSLAAIGLAMVYFSIYIFKLYRDSFRVNPERVMASDLFLAIFMGGWSVPVVFSTLLFYLGVTLLFVSASITVVLLQEVFGSQHVPL
ncbi:MAG: hypothetical protein AB2657_08320 [Candidatus Thiodiazotropha endolucinida]